MSKWISLLSLLLMGIALGGCGPIKVYSDYNRETDFTPYKTYAWAEPASLVDRTANPMADSDIVEARIKRLVDNAAKSQNLPKVDKSQADFLIRYAIQINTKVRSTPSTSIGFGAGFYSRSTAVMVSSGDVSSYDEGALLIEFVDAKTGKAFWNSSTKVPMGDTDKVKEIWADVVPRMIAQFPPKDE